MLLRYKENTEELTEGNEYVAMAVKVSSNGKEILLYDDPSNLFVDSNLLEIPEGQKFPSDWTKSSVKNGEYYLGYKELVDNPEQHYGGLLERSRDDVRTYRLEYAKQVLNDPEADAKIAKYDSISELDLFPEFAELAHKEALAQFTKIEQTQAPVVVYVKSFEPWGLQTELFMQENGIDHLSVDVTDNPELLEYIIDTLGQRVVPVCVGSDGEVVVGYNPEAFLKFKK